MLAPALTACTNERDDWSFSISHAVFRGHVGASDSFPDSPFALVLLAAFVLIPIALDLVLPSVTGLHDAFVCIGCG